ncbi:MAG: YkvA family protein [Bacillota bacterium]
MPKFTEAQLLRFLGRLANKWGTGHQSITKILTKVEQFLEEKKEKIDFLDRVHLLVAMLKDHSNQQFYIDDGTLGLIIACLAYLVLPTDLVPDFIPIVGFTDDAAAFTIVFNQLSSEIERYRKWKDDLATEENTICLD